MVLWCCGVVCRHCAQDTYRFGHIEALKLAHEAGQEYHALMTKAPVPPAAAFYAVSKKLIRAYAMDGFVSHFLSDQFSSGHLRTPRVELRTACNGVVESAPSAGLTANVMHDEDNWNCVLVKNKRNNIWWACGDHRFFDQENAMNRRMLHDAIAASVGEVSAAFLSSADPKAANVNPIPVVTAKGAQPAAMDYLGFVGPLSSRQSVENTCAMFKLSARKIQIRDGALNTFPRPAGAATHGWGSSLRWLMSAELFPQFVSIEAAAGAGIPAPNPLAQSDDAFQATLANQDDRKCTAYREFATSDCCNVLGRAVPVWAADPFAGSRDVPVGFQQNTQAGANKAKRSTYLNQCRLTQVANGAASAVGNAASSAASAVGNAASSAASAVGNAASGAASAVGSAASAAGSALVSAAVAPAQWAYNLFQASRQ